jgi:MFS family permease
MKQNRLKKVLNENQVKAFQLIVMFGVISLLGDMVYEGARSVNGSFLKTLGATAALAGFISGLGEWLGYGIRLASGLISDKTRNYWLFTILGYGMLISVPLLALAGRWEIAAVFIVLERVGKALRSPAKDTIMSQAAKQVGTGIGFGLHEAMDQIGAFAGPLLFTAVFLLKKDYQFGYGILIIPFGFLMVSVFIAFFRFPSPEKLETSAVAGKAAAADKPVPDKLTKIFWLYSIFSFLTVAGFANFTVLAFHFKAKSVFTDMQIPLFYAIAMGVDAVIALAAGYLYDKKGLMTLIALPLLSIPILFLGLSRNFLYALIAVLLWGAVMGIQETIMRAAIADLTSLKKRGTGYGIFNTIYGLAWFFGGWMIGLLYDQKPFFAMLFGTGMELLALPLLFLIYLESRKME